MVGNEIYISVDVETSGPIPGEFSLLSIGACLVSQPATAFYLEIQPSSPRHDQQSVAVSGLDLDKLQRDGLPPAKAMREFDTWIKSVSLLERKPVFVGLNAPFDWSFVNYYFHQYMGSNPFGFTAIDMKAYFMGAFGCSWNEAKSSNMAATLKPQSKPTHNALDDARFQAELFELMLSLKREQNLR